MIQEKAWIKKHRVIRAGGPNHFPPFHWYNANGLAVGIGPEFATVILGRLGLKIDYQPVAPWPEVLEKIKDGRLDLIACAARSIDREPYLNYSESYLFYPLVIISHKDVAFIGGIDDLHDRKVAIGQL